MRLSPYPLLCQIPRGRVTGGQIVSFPQLVLESTSMVGGGSNPQGSRYTHNDAAFVEYNTRLQSNNLPTFSSAASKFTEWLSSDKAYYPSARASVSLYLLTSPSYTSNCRTRGQIVSIVEVCR